MASMFHSLYLRTQSASPELPATAGSQTVSAFRQFPVSYADSIEAWDPDHWQLEVGGLVERPHAFTFKEVSGFTRIQQTRRQIFADGFAIRATWEGFIVQELLHRVAPKPQARFLIQTNLAGHQECIPLLDLYSQRALFCLGVAGEALPALQGGPLRLMVFDRYAHKGLGQLAKLELSDHEIPGYYADKGYDSHGVISPGEYYAADLQRSETVTQSGEITDW